MRVRIRFQHKEKSHDHVYAFFMEQHGHCGRGAGVFRLRWIIGRTRPGPYRGQ
jgi:hypothetical protein